MILLKTLLHNSILNPFDAGSKNISVPIALLTETLPKLQYSTVCISFFKPFSPKIFSAKFAHIFVELYNVHSKTGKQRLSIGSEIQSNPIEAQVIDGPHHFIV